MILFVVPLHCTSKKTYLTSLNIKLTIFDIINFSCQNQYTTQSCSTDGVGKGQDMTVTWGKRGVCPGRILGCRIKSRRTTTGANSAYRGMAVGAPLNRQWDRVRGAVVEGIPLPAL